MAASQDIPFITPDHHPDNIAVIQVETLDDALRFADTAFKREGIQGVVWPRAVSEEERADCYRLRDRFNQAKAVLYGNGQNLHWSQKNPERDKLGLLAYMGDRQRKDFDTLCVHFSKVAFLSTYLHERNMDKVLDPREPHFDITLTAATLARGEAQPNMDLPFFGAELMIMRLNNTGRTMPGTIVYEDHAACFRDFYSYLDWGKKGNRSLPVAWQIRPEDTLMLLNPDLEKASKEDPCPLSLSHSLLHRAPSHEGITADRPRNLERFHCSI